MKTKFVGLSIALLIGGTAVVVALRQANDTESDARKSPIEATAASKPGASLAWPPPGMRTVVETKTKLVNYTVMNRVYEKHQKEVNYTVMKPVYETKEKTITYTVCTMVPETKTKTVEYTTCRMVPETKQKTIEYQEVRYVPVDDSNQ